MVFLLNDVFNMLPHMYEVFLDIMDKLEDWKKE